ncbi:MAG: SapC family protein [Pseudomonadota bacterium]
MPRNVPLNNVEHQNLRVMTGFDARFGDSVNQVPVFPTEFRELQKEYPIVFRNNADGGLQAVALLGLDLDENLFLADGRWNARYVPAIQQRGPFLIGLRATSDGAPGGDPVVHIDLDHPRVSEDEGEFVFLPHGGNSAYLDHVTGVLQAINDGHALSEPMFAAFEKAEILEPVSLRLSLSDTEQYTIDQCMAVSEEKIAGLSAEVLKELNGSGFLTLAIHAAASLTNIPYLLELKNRKKMERS